MKMLISRLSLAGIAIILCATFLVAQPDTLWTRTAGGDLWDAAYDVVATTDGGCIAVGGSSSFGHEKGDLYLIRFDADGDTVWTRVFGDEGWDEGRGICVTSDGNYAVTGHTFSYGEIYADVWLMKISGDGDSLWAKTYGEAAGDFGWDLCELTDGGFLITGDAFYSETGWDMYLVKIDAEGDELWTNHFGGYNDDIGFSVIEASDGGYVIAGASNSFDDGDADAYVVKTDSDGVLQWEKTYGDIGWGKNDEVHDICKTSDGDFIITGSTESYGEGKYDFYVLRIDPAGDTVWTRTYGGSKNEFSRGICEASDSSWIIAGASESFSEWNYDVWAVKIDINGDSFWTAQYGTPEDDYALGVCAGADGSFFFAGQTSSPEEESNFYIVKTEIPSGIEEKFLTVSDIELKTFINRIAWSISDKRSGNVKLDLYSTDGRLMLSETVLHKDSWKAPTTLSQGVYFAQITAGSCSAKTKLIVIR